ncbi:hypothetical protein, partial [Agreia sp.]|uniref:hypothetical protein n=1 Tax=Agreia sp. TaxID=1872416 RepID=UPI0035BBB15D
MPISQGDVPVLPVTTPAPEPVCTPISYDSVAPETNNWAGTNSPVEGLAGLVQSWDADDSGAVESLVAASSMYPLPAIVTLAITDYSAESDDA